MSAQEKAWLVFIARESGGNRSVVAGQAERQDVSHLKARGRSNDFYNAVILLTLDLTNQLVKRYDCGIAFPNFPS